MITSYNVIKGNDQFYIQAKRMKARQAFAALKKIQKGGTGHILNAHISTQVPALHLERAPFDPQTFYATASARPYTFKEFISFVSSLGKGLLKAWLVCGKAERIEHEVSLSNSGISIDGWLREETVLAQGIDNILRNAPSSIKSQTYYIGENAGALIIGEIQTYGLDIETNPIKAEITTTTTEGEYSLHISGAIRAANFEDMARGLLKQPNFLSLEFTQPSLSSVVRHANLYQNVVKKTFHLDLMLAETIPQIIENFRRTIF